MAWITEQKKDSIYDSAYKPIDNWEDALVNWETLTVGKFPKESWTNESIPSENWTKEV